MGVFCRFVPNGGQIYIRFKLPAFLLIPDDMSFEGMRQAHRAKLTLNIQK
jgi:hypothetical protein